MKRFIFPVLAVLCTVVAVMNAGLQSSLFLHELKVPKALK